jgi:hypothetical protein
MSYVPATTWGGLEWYDVRVHEPNRRVSMNEVDAADELGPVDWIVVEFPGSRMNGEIVPALRDLVSVIWSVCLISGVEERMTTGRLRRLSFPT